MLQRGADRFPLLTSRQKEVVQLVADGLTDKDIARRLGIRYRTVRSHLETVYLKFGVTTRAGLVGVYLRRGHHMR
jgi:DNA-binding CsgD family transcriptional regulator